MASRVLHSPLKPFGVEAWVDLTQPLSPEDKEDLRRLYACDGVLAIRDLRLSMDQQLDLCSVFGPVMRGSRENYLVSNVLEEGLLGDKELRFHTDIPFVPAPYYAGSLHAIEVADGVSGTRFASGFRTYERLPLKLRDRIANLNGLFIKTGPDERRTRMTDLKPGANCAVHAIVQRQKDTGRPYVFINSNTIGLIIGLSEADSEALIEELFSYYYVVDDIYEHTWRQGDFVIWDNKAINHARAKIVGGTRTLQRVSDADNGFWEQYPVDLPTFEQIHYQRKTA
jgi:taurine dioxygenase